MAFVYFYKHKKLTPIKIGFTRSLNARLSQFLNASPYGGDFIDFIETDNYIRLELYLHDYFKDKRLNGEWFEITIDEVKFIKEKLKNSEFKINKIENKEILKYKSSKDKILELYLKGECYENIIFQTKKPPWYINECLKRIKHKIY